MRKVLKLDPSNASALYYIGVQAQEDGREQQAREMWKKALVNMAPTDPLAANIRDRLAMAPHQEEGR